ncbi:sulfite exporter TauE/SafE family protein [Methylobacter sp. S3L5C]|uniref:sulfite exporter TauE/SafE family protein n=1 Tax=Methylobacter sp. S3L5C TaxID=2839024 RepID=UPI001FABE6B3|nr:sulfite exporter TauE/SafE family protein [Methylobacter sp. S3L5C]UOA09075.1 sulfite exporter TauE/SafE family protein [Methylobacter sp. S3L5C]
MIEIFLVSIVLGMVTGLLAGLFGIGGGLVIVPVLVILFTAQGFPAELIMLMAVATSLASIILTAIASISAHHRLGSVVWGKVFSLSPGIIIGAAVGAVIAKHINADTLRIILVVFLLYVAIQMALQIKPKSDQIKQSRILDFLVANIIGLLSSIVGIGGGTLTVPYLVRGQMLMRNAVAVSSACGLPIAIAGTVSYAILGWKILGLPEWSLGYVYLPVFIGTGLSSIATAPIGAKLAHKLPAAKLKRYFSLLLFVMAAKLMWY